MPPISPTPDRPWRSVEDYLDELLCLVAPLSAEGVPLEDAVGRTCATDLSARVSIPRFDVSAMDGYAVRWADVESGAVDLPVVADLPAGTSVDREIGPGECARIMTGAPLPTGTDTVVPVELTDGGADQVHIGAVPDRGCGAHVRHPGEDVGLGDLVVGAGSVITAGALAALAATGHAQVPVHRVPRVAVAATGSELRPAGAPLRAAEIHESNSWFVASTLELAGACAARYDVLKDDPDAISAALDAMTAEADLVILTGGAGAGAHDVPGQVLRQVHSGFRRVRMHPGKPQGWAVWRDTPVLLLPGNPVAAAVSTVVFAVPLVQQLLGRAEELRPQSATITTTFATSPERTGFVPCELRPDGCGGLTITPTHVRAGSHLVSSLVDADVFAVVPPGTAPLPAGAVVRVVATRPLA